MSTNALYSGDYGRKPIASAIDLPFEAPGITLTLRVSDPEAVAELLKYGEGAQREMFALSALRLGILTLRQAVDGRQ